VVCRCGIGEKGLKCVFVSLENSELKEGQNLIIAIIQRFSLYGELGDRLELTEG